MNDRQSKRRRPTAVGFEKPHARRTKRPNPRAKPAVIVCYRETDDAVDVADAYHWNGAAWTPIKGGALTYRTLKDAKAALPGLDATPPGYSPPLARRTD